MLKGFHYVDMKEFTCNALPKRTALVKPVPHRVCSCGKFDLKVSSHAFRYAPSVSSCVCSSSGLLSYPEYLSCILDINIKAKATEHELENKRSRDSLQKIISMDCHMREKKSMENFSAS